MKTKKSLRVGLVGCGHVAQFAHIPALKRIKQAELASVCDVNSAVAQEIAKRFSIQGFYASLSEMLQDERLDIVDICTPPDTHASLALQAMEAGCHVLVEKPMALNTQESDQMIKASQNLGLKLGIGHNMLLHPLISRAISMVTNGYIGELAGLDIQYLLNRYRGAVARHEHWCHNLHGGIFTNKLPPPISLAMAFLRNLEPVAVQSIKYTDREWLIADDLRVILQGDNGMATITVSTNCPKDIFILDIFGTKRNLHLHLNNAVMYTCGMARYGRCSVVFENFRQGLQILTGTASTALKTALRKHHFGHYALLLGFIESIQNDTEPPITAEEGRESIRLIEKIISQIENDPRYMRG
ncbi:MAG TPA: Gfo/Idh/MocA family oxidoreductase [Dehalococcoidia bacterium]|nr:Gfo/Idh/MocA family oxidoreductase [Dehalococcoidia bacterium]